MILLVVVAAVVLAAVGGAYVLRARESEASKLTGVFSGRGSNTVCAKAGVIAFAGGRSTVYRCSWEKPWAGVLTTTVVRCAVWVDGAAYDVTTQARAAARLSGQARLC